MFDDLDNKGKVFTNIITKKAIKVVIQTLTHRLEGEMHIKPDHRLLDELNNPEDFIALTNVSILNLRQEPICKSSFLSLNKKQIIWIAPEEEIITG